MSPAPPRLDTLSYDMIDMIISYLPPPDITKKGETVTVPLMRICPRWRTAYTQKYFSTLVIRDQKRRKKNFSFEITPPSVDPPIQLSDLIVRTLTIGVTHWGSITSGTTVSWMKTSPQFVDFDFSSVTTLIVDACYKTNPYSHRTTSASIEADNVAAFFRHIKSVTPNANDIKLYLSKSGELFSERPLSTAIESSIAELVNGRNFSFCGGHSEFCLSNLNPTAISGLTSLCIGFGDSYSNSDEVKWAVGLARCNAGTLKRMPKLSINLDQLEQLLFCDGSPSIYSCLDKIDIRISHRRRVFDDFVDRISSRYPTVCVNHFPALKQLKFSGSYGVAISLLLGPENRSLEDLDVNVFSLFPDYNNPIRPCPLDVLTRFYGLQTVRLTAFDDSDYDSVEPPEHKAMCAYILNSFSGSPSASYSLHIKLDAVGDALELLDKNLAWAALRELDLRYTMFSFDEICDLLKRAPMLRSFICYADEAQPTVDGVDLVEQPAYLKERYYPLSTTLSELGFGFFNYAMSIGRDPRSWYTVLLATVCPQLQDLRMIEGFRELDECFDIPSYVRGNDCISDQADSLDESVYDAFRIKSLFS